MRRRILGTVLATLGVLTGLQVVATPAAASHTCADAVPMGAGSEMGTVTTQGTTGTFEVSDWWRHSATPSPRTITVAGDGEVDLFVYGACDTTPLCSSAQNGSDTCTVAQSGSLAIEVRLRIPTSTSANYSLTVSVPPPTQCSDGQDNDGDGAVDFPADRHCTSLNDPTEAAARSAIWGGMEFSGDTRDVPFAITLVRWGVFASNYDCAIEFSPVQVVCDAIFDPNVEWHCSTFPLQVMAPNPRQSTRVGNISGRANCDSGAVVRTADVLGRGTARTSNTEQNIDLGTGYRVVCRAAGVVGDPNPFGSFSVMCAAPSDPGLIWPPVAQPVVEVFHQAPVTKHLP